MKLFLFFPAVLWLGSLKNSEAQSQSSIPVSGKLSGIKSGHHFVDDPLFLTPYIKTRRICEARRRSLVKGLPGFENLESYTGFLTINETYNSNTFFWFFPSKDRSRPLVVWFQGGPGWSSLYGLFNMNGPIEITKDLTPRLREDSWTKAASLLFIDNPIGTGFSFTNEDAGYARGEEQIADDLYEALSQFFIIFHDFKSSPFYLTGESYAGKYICSLGHRIHKENPAGINLHGIALGNAFIDPLSQLSQGEYLYQVGLIDEKQLEIYKRKEKEVTELIESGQYLMATLAASYRESLYSNFTGLSYTSNILYVADPIPRDYVDYLRQPHVRKAIKVANLSYELSSTTVSMHLLDDMLRSVKPEFEVLLNSDYKILIYNGHLDTIFPVVSTQKFLLSVKWKHADLYRNAERKIWKVNSTDEEVAGYVHKVNNLAQVVVRNAGHMAPFDQPRVILDLMKRFLNDDL